MARSPTRGIQLEAYPLDLPYDDSDVKCYLERFTDLELVSEQGLPYPQSSNVDAVYLLEEK